MVLYRWLKIQYKLFVLLLLLCRIVLLQYTVVFAGLSFRCFFSYWSALTSPNTGYCSVVLPIMFNGTSEVQLFFLCLNCSYVYSFIYIPACVTVLVFNCSYDPSLILGSLTLLFNCSSNAHSFSHVKDVLLVVFNCSSRVQLFSFLTALLILSIFNTVD